MKPETVDVVGSFLLEIDWLGPDGLARSDHIGKKDHISIFHVLAQIRIIVIEAHPAMIVK